MPGRISTTVNAKLTRIHFEEGPRRKRRAVSNCVKNHPQSLPFLLAGNSQRGFLFILELCVSRVHFEKYTLENTLRNPNLKAIGQSFQKNIISHGLKIYYGSQSPYLVNSRIWKQLLLKTNLTLFAEILDLRMG